MLAIFFILPDFHQAFSLKVRFLVEEVFPVIFFLYILESADGSEAVLFNPFTGLQDQNMWVAFFLSCCLPYYKVTGSRCIKNLVTKVSHPF